MTNPPAPERVEAWRPALAGVVEVFHARFIGHRYPPHEHDAWAVLIVDDGAICYDLERRHRGGDTSSVTVLPPHVVHDGRAASDAGFSKRVVYLDTDLLPERHIGHGVDRSEIADADLRVALAGLHDCLRGRDEATDGEERLDWIARRLRMHLGDEAHRPPAPQQSGAAQLRDYLAAHADKGVTLAAASATIGVSVAHLARTFRTAYDISPYAFVVGLRVERARRLLLDGYPPAEVAALAGFYDQAHLHRHFVRHTGTTPGRFNRAGARG